MLNFKIFNIPVRVEPLFWLCAFLIAGGFSINGRESLIAIVFAMLAIFLSILVHELGHALTSRKLTRVTPSIRLVAMGGLASPNTRLTRAQSFRVTWAGPLAGLGLFLVVVLSLALVFGITGASHFTAASILPGIPTSPAYAEVASSFNLFSFFFVRTLLFANFWWSLLNLLPVFPLDGGQIYASIEESQARVFRVGRLTGGLAAVACLLFGLLIGGLLFGFLAYQNHQRLQQITGVGGDFR